MPDREKPLSENLAAIAPVMTAWAEYFALCATHVKDGLIQASLRMLAGSLRYAATESGRVTLWLQPPAA